MVMARKWTNKALDKDDDDCNANQVDDPARYGLLLRRRTNVRNVSTLFSTTRCINLFLDLQLFP